MKSLDLQPQEVDSPFLRDRLLTLRIVPQEHWHTHMERLPLTQSKCNTVQ